MATHMRLADRTFFIYDHSVTKKEEDDPQDAIIYFFPPNTSVDIQCIFCNQLMGMVKCTETIAGSPPKLYKLKRNKVATKHEGNFTLALASKLRTPDSALIRKLENLYQVFTFYHGSISKVKQISVNYEAFLSTMASIWDFYVPYVRRYGNLVPAMFEPIPRVKLVKSGNVLFLRCSHLLQWMKGQPSLLAGCILYKRSVLCSQLSPELTSHLLLIKPNQLHHPSKSVTDTVLPFGVRIMSVYVTEEQYKELSKTLHPVLRHRPSLQAKRSDGFLQRPAAPNGESQPWTGSQAASRRMLEKRPSSSTGRLFSNFTRMLEGTVVESLWPSGAKSGTASPKPVSQLGGVKRDSLMEESRGVTRGVGEEEVLLSRSSADVVAALQGDDEQPPRRQSSGITHDAPAPYSSTNTADKSDRSPRNWNYRNSPTSLQNLESQSSHFYRTVGVLSDSQPVQESVAPKGVQPESDLGFAEADQPSSDSGDKSMNDNATKLAASHLPERIEEDEACEQNSKCDIKEASSTHSPTVADGDLRKILRIDLVLESVDSSSQLDRATKSTSVPSDQTDESPESGIGDCLLEHRHEEVNSINHDVRDEDSGLDGSVQTEPFGRTSPVQESSPSGSHPDTTDSLFGDSPQCQDETFENKTISVIAKVEANPLNTKCVGSDEGPMNGYNMTATNEEALTSTDSQANEEASQSFEEPVTTYDHAALSETNSDDFHPSPAELEAFPSKPDILQSSEDEQKENPDLLESSVMRSSLDLDGTDKDFEEDINSNAAHDKLEFLSTTSDSAGEIEDAIGEARVGETPEEGSPSHSGEDSRTLTDTEERTFIDDEDDNDVEAVSGQDVSESQDKVLQSNDEEKQVLLTNHDAETDTSERHSTPSVLEQNDTINRPSSGDELTRKDEVRTLLSEDQICDDRHQALGEMWKDDQGEIGQQQEASTNDDQNIEMVPDLVNVSLYVQAHSDTTLLFLAEKSIMEDKDTLFQLWQSVLRELGELELQLKNMVRPDGDTDCNAAYNFIYFDKQEKSLEGSITNPVEQTETHFCRSCHVTHEQFQSDHTLTDITLRNHQTVFYAHQNACHHAFFHKRYKAIPGPGIPSRDDAGFYIQNTCKELIREHNKNLL